jgi:DNA-binding NarL/FixJ family response regulator
MSSSAPILSEVLAPARLAVVAADPETRDRLVDALLPDFTDVVAADGLDELEARGELDVVVFACKRYRADEAELTRNISRLQGARRVVVVSASHGPGQVRKALESGAFGFLYEDEVDAMLATAVRATAAGQICVPEEFRRQVIKPVLTTREKQILGLVIMGLSNGEISRRLYLAESTVKSHLSTAFSKLGVRSRNEAAALILDPDVGFGPGILRISDEQPLGPAFGRA